MTANVLTFELTFLIKSTVTFSPFRKIASGAAKYYFNSRWKNLNYLTQSRAYGWSIPIYLLLLYRCLGHPCICSELRNMYWCLTLSKSAFIFFPSWSRCAIYWAIQSMFVHRRLKIVCCSDDDGLTSSVIGMSTINLRAINKTIIWSSRRGAYESDTNASVQYSLQLMWQCSSACQKLWLYWFCLWVLLINSVLSNLLHCIQVLDCPCLARSSVACFANEHNLDGLTFWLLPRIFAM